MWYLNALIIIVVGQIIGKFWPLLFTMDENRRVRALWKGQVSFIGRLVFQFGSVVLALVLVPWELLSIPAQFALVISIVVGMLLARLDDTIAGLLNISTIRIGYTLEKEGAVFRVTDRSLQRVFGITPDGEEVSYGFSDFMKGSIINWTAVPFARSQILCHIDDPIAGIPEVYEAINSVLKLPNGELNPKYSVLFNETLDGDSADKVEKHAWVKYDGELGDSTLYRIAIFHRYRSELPALSLDCKEEIWFALKERNISTGQTTNITATVSN